MDLFLHPEWPSVRFEPTPFAKPSDGLSDSPRPAISEHDASLRPQMAEQSPSAANDASLSVSG